MHPEEIYGDEHGYDPVDDRLSHLTRFADQSMEDHSLHWSEWKNLSKEKKALQAEVGALKAENQSLKEANQSLETKCADYEKKIGQLETRNSVLSRNMEILSESRESSSGSVSAETLLDEPSINRTVQPVIPRRSSNISFAP